MKFTTFAIITISASFSEASLRGIRKRRTNARMEGYETQQANVETSDGGMAASVFEEFTSSMGGVATSDATNVGVEEEEEEQMEKSDEEFVKEEQEADEIQEGEKVDEEEEPDEDIPFKWKEGLKPDEEDLVSKPPDGIEEKRDPCLALGESFTEEEYDDCMAKGMENMQEETGSVEESSVETMTAKVMTTSTVYTFADGTSVTETVDANGVKVLTTDSGQSITLGANVSQENMDTEVKPDTLLGDTVTSAPVPMPPTNPSPSSPPTNRPSSIPSKNPTPSQESSAGNPASTSTYSTLGSFTDLTASYDQMQEETGSVEESSVGTMTAKVMTTSTVYTFADGTSVTETVDANGVKVLTTDSGQSITLGANVSQENMDTEVEPAPEVVSFTDAKGATFTDVTASEDLMEMQEDVSFTDAKGATFTDLTASEDVMEMKEDVSFTDAKGKVFTDEIITFEEDEEESYEEDMTPPSEDEEDEEESYEEDMTPPSEDEEEYYKDTVDNQEEEEGYYVP